MKKGIIFGVLIVFLLLFTTKTVLGFSGNFGGRIISTTAIEIQVLEWFGYECFVPGSTISIIPIGSPVGTPTSYLIPYGIYSKTGYDLRSGQLILGKYSWKSPISCVLSYYPFTPTTVFLDTIPLFGNSR